MSFSVIAVLIFSVACAQAGNVAPELLGFNFTYSGGFNYYSLANLSSMYTNPNFNTSRTTVFYVVGLLQRSFDPRPVMVRDAYMSTGKYNVILLDVPDTFTYNFLNAESIGNQTAQSIVALLNAGLNTTNKYELAGFSLGAQICGYIARGIKYYSNNKYKVPRIHGLDPAINLWLIKDLSKSDANFVMTIHTAFVLGNITLMGHLGFLVNLGFQPSCTPTVILTEPDCNHQMVQFYWAEAITKGATSFRTDWYCDFGGCRRTYMNPWTPPNPNNVLFTLFVNAQSPYSKN